MRGFFSSMAIIFGIVGLLVVGLVLIGIGLAYVGNGALAALSRDLATPVADAPAKSPAICFTVESLQAALAERSGEALVFTGRVAGEGGEAIILFAGKEGGWTLAQLFASGTACLIATGEGARLPKGIVIVPRGGERPA